MYLSPAPQALDRIGMNSACRMRHLQTRPTLPELRRTISTPIRHNNTDTHNKKTI
jgi:hypothetical protein